MHIQEGLGSDMLLKSVRGAGQTGRIRDEALLRMLKTPYAATNPNGPSLVPHGGTLGPDGYTFGVQQGLSLSGVGHGPVWPSADRRVWCPGAEFYMFS
jgi:hypothetical protein